MDSAGGRYAERMLVPVWVWAVAVVLSGSLAIAFGAYLGAAVGWTVLVVALALSSGLLIRAAGTIRLDDGGLRAGRARLPVSSFGTVDALDARAAARTRGRDADPRAFLYLKGWVPTAVRIDVTDRVDPTPYWYVSTRFPDRLADALIEARDDAGGQSERSYG